MILNELTKSGFLSKSKTTPLARYSRRLQIKDVLITKVGLLELHELGQPNIDIYFQVSSASGTGYYDVSVKLYNFLDILRTNFTEYSNSLPERPKSIKRSVLRKLIDKSLRTSINNNDVGLFCTCPDFKYRFAYLATLNQYNFSQSDAQYIPALIRNPDNQGSGCKHLVRVLTTTSKWIPKVTTAIINLIVQYPKILTS